jgi:2-keto-4-pentenoate hydratase/2-oxohepta-3-ene-1,7-dioic acid hydratase in catechol pathway
MSARHAIGTLAAAAEAALGPDRLAALAPEKPVTVLGVLEGWDRWSSALQQTADALVNGEQDAVPQVEQPATWLAPILHPRKVIGIGANYKDHLDFAGIPYPETPYLFLKPASTTLLGSGRQMVIPRQVEYADWEGELAAIIGRRARDVSEADALQFVAGYAAANDFSARDWLANAIPPLGSDWLLHKGWDGFTPIGPSITPAAFVTDPQRLGIRLSVDGVTKQDGNTSSMVFTVAQLVAHASTIMTLEPGDVLLTGTPMGSGFAREPRERLAPGQTMVVEVDGLDTLSTPTVAEQ